jgi:hypothetical protein
MNRLNKRANRTECQVDTGANPDAKYMIISTRNQQAAMRGRPEMATTESENGSVDQACWDMRRARRRAAAEEERRAAAIAGGGRGAEGGVCWFCGP